MTELRQRLKLPFGSKGVVFTLDATLAAITVVVLLSMAFHYTTSTYFDQTEKTEMVRTGNDFLTVLHYDGTLELLNNDEIENKMDAMLPNNYGMLITITAYEYNDVTDSFDLSTSFEVGDDIPENGFVGSGNRHFVTFTSGKNRPSKYTMARFYVWGV